MSMLLNIVRQNSRIAEYLVYFCIFLGSFFWKGGKNENQTNLEQQRGVSEKRRT